ncbi:exonuclease SbcC [Nakamurella sp. UYEF19]|uniref:SMC family ATPase n=1 Tax=Nakamurella sp. UYEF19 TaxID=1756392 RepID=UPI0033987802
MRLHRLQLSAFGPFADVIDVDLDLLGADGLFLLHGDTGAGKTTLLDAISFALFGRVPGARNDAKRLRCDRADPSTRTFVRIEATLGGRRVEIVRSPAYLRAKARGTGMTEEKHKVLLRWLDAPPDGGDAAVTGGSAGAEGLTRAEEVGLAVKDLLGMSADQFFQVVLLPQGDFARFLRSDTAEREVLLERLFDTGRFGTIEEWFSGERRASGARVREHRERIGRLVARAAEAAGRPGGPDEQDLAEWLADLRDRLADDAAVSAERADRMRKRFVAADQRLRVAVKLAERLTRLRILQERQGELERAAGERASWRRSLAAHAEAAPLVAAGLQATRLASRARDQLGVVDRLRSAAEARLTPNEDLPKTAVDLRVLSARTRVSSGALTGLVLLSGEQERDRAALVTLQASHAEVVRRVADLEVVLAELPGAIATDTVRADVSRAAAERIGALAEQAVAARALLDATEAVDRARSGLVLAAALSVAATDEHQRAVDRRQHLVERRILGMAAELAAGLQGGDSCPVCGSPDHPRLAVSEAGAVTPAQVAAAEKSERVAASARTAASAGHESALVSLARAETLAHGRTRDEATESFAAVSAHLQQESQLAAELPSVQAGLAKLLAQQQAAERERQELNGLQGMHAAEIVRLTAAIDDRSDRISEGCAGFPDVRARQQHLVELADSLDRLAAASELLDTADVLEAEAANSLTASIAASSFLDLGAARAAGAVDAEDLAQRLRAAEDELTGITARLSDPELVGLDPSAEPEVTGARDDAASARSSAENAATGAAAAAARRDQVTVATANLASAWRSMEPVLTADAELAALTDVILGKGQNARAMSLRTYVLAAKLGQVAQSAGQRLSAMSGGRYTFEQSLEKEARGRSGGLGLDILDAFSGLVRPAKTLSGGESFLASLSLALGLADVVAAEAGGRQLDTMFIDEGFGSLDADTLDMVMGTLDDLRAGGRIVGVVSHVDELRQRIPSRLRISRTPAGSELQMSTG